MGRVDELARTCDRVLVLGTSFGAEAALLTGARSCQVSAVVAFAPSDVVWAGIRPDGAATSHWTLGGKTLPWVPLDETWEPAGDVPAFVGLFEASRQRFPQRLDAAAIPVEQINQVLLVAGGDDQVWPAVSMSEAIKARRAEPRSRDRHRHRRRSRTSSGSAKRAARERRRAHASRRHRRSGPSPRCRCVVPHHPTAVAMRRSVWLSTQTVWCRGGRVCRSCRGGRSSASRCRGEVVRSATRCGSSAGDADDRGGAKLWSQVSPPSAWGVQWSLSQCRAGREHQGNTQVGSLRATRMAIRAPTSYLSTLTGGFRSMTWVTFTSVACLPHQVATCWARVGRPAPPVLVSTRAISPPGAP